MATQVQAQAVEAQGNVQESTSKAIQPDLVAPEIKVWKPPVVTATGPSVDLPDSYFQPTAGELKSAYDGQVRTREKLIGGPLRTGVAKERELEEQRKRAKYPKTRVRIRFADRTQVETTFASSSRIPAVYAFTKSILSEEASSKAFVLYQTPPRREFKASDSKIKDKSLYDLQLIPTAVLFIKFEDDTLNDGKKEPPIKPALLELAEELPRPPSFDPTPADLAALARTQEADAAKGEKKSEGVKAPKWLTAMKKK